MNEWPRANLGKTTWLGRTEEVKWLNEWSLLCCACSALLCWLMLPNWVSLGSEPEGALLSHFLSLSPDRSWYDWVGRDSAPPGGVGVVSVWELYFEGRFTHVRFLGDKLREGVFQMFRLLPSRSMETVAPRSSRQGSHGVGCIMFLLWLLANWKDKDHWILSKNTLWDES